MKKKLPYRRGVWGFIIVFLYSGLQAIVNKSPGYQQTQKDSPMFFVTAADSDHYGFVLALIGSIHKFHFADLGEIAVYDLGLSEKQKNILQQIKHVCVFTVPPVNEIIFKKFVVRPYGKIARGWYSWKPVVFFEALKLYPCFLYLDSAFILQDKIYDIFDAIKREGYFLMTNKQAIEDTLPKRVWKWLDLTNAELRSECISAGLQGLSRNVLSSYIEPVYRLAYDIKYFEDDGSCPGGFGEARHDQPLFSVFVNRSHLKFSQIKHLERFYLYKPAVMSVENGKLQITLRGRNFFSKLFNGIERYIQFKTKARIDLCAAIDL